MAREASVGAVVALMFLLTSLLVGCGKDEDRFGIAHVEPIGDRLLLVEHQKYTGQERTSGGRDYDHTSRRFTLITMEGRILERVVERATGDLTGDRWGIHGFSNDVVWLKDGAGDKSLYARTLSDLSIVPGIAEAIEGHPMLSKKKHVLGSDRSGVVLLGPDERVYVLNARGEIEQKPETVRCKPNYECKWSEDDGRQVAVYRFTTTERVPPIEGRPPKLDDSLRLIRPLPLPVILSDPTSVLVSSVDFDGSGNTKLLSRVSGAATGPHWTASEILWTASSRELLQLPDASEMPTVDIVWVRHDDGRLRAMLEAAWTGERNPRYAHKLVELDPKTGTLVSSHEITK